MTGRGFDCGTNSDDAPRGVHLSWASGGADPIEVIPQEPDGSFAGDLVVPADGTGVLDVEARCSRGDNRWTESFTVTTVALPPSPKPSLSTPSNPGSPSTVPPSTGPTRTAAPAPARSSARPQPSPEPLVETSAAPSPSPAASHPASSSSGGFHPIRAGWSLPTVDQLSLDDPGLVLVAFLAALVILLVAFPAEIVNKTWEQHKDEIRRALGGRGPALPAWVWTAVMVGLAVIIAFWFSDDEGPAGTNELHRGNPLLHAVALLLAVPLVMAAYTGPGELYLRKIRGGAKPYVPKGALVMALACAGASQAWDLKPNYAYGLFLIFVLLPRTGTAVTPTGTQRARGILLGAAGLTALVASAWLGFTANWAQAHGGGAPWFSVLIDAVCYWVIVLGVESLVFALIPMRFLDGSVLAAWSKPIWFVLQFLAAFFFLHVVYFRGETNPIEDGPAALLKALAFFAMFGLASLAFWGYFQLERRPTARFALRPRPRPRPRTRTRPRAGAGKL